jgi:hypothetical protein
MQDLRLCHTRPEAAEHEGMVVIAPPIRRAVACSCRVPVPVELAVASLQGDPGGVIGARLPEPANQPQVTLGVAGPGGVQINRDVRVGFGPLLQDEGIHALPVWWEAVEHPRWFPTFDGGFELVAADGDTELRLVGSYRPPLGSVGAFADGIVGHRLVMASLEALLRRVAEQLAARADFD